MGKLKATIHSIPKSELRAFLNSGIVTCHRFRFRIGLCENIRIGISVRTMAIGGNLKLHIYIYYIYIFNYKYIYIIYIYIFNYKYIYLYMNQFKSFLKERQNDSVICSIH